jgi:hypothetical protein
MAQGAGDERPSYRWAVDGKRYHAFVYGRPARQLSRANIRCTASRWTIMWRHSDPARAVGPDEALA